MFPVFAAPATQPASACDAKPHEEKSAMRFVKRLLENRYFQHTGICLAAPEHFDGIDGELDDEVATLDHDYREVAVLPVMAVRSSVLILAKC